MHIVVHTPCVCIILIEIFFLHSGREHSLVSYRFVLLVVYINVSLKALNAYVVCTYCALSVSFFPKNRPCTHIFGIGLQNTTISYECLWFTLSQTHTRTTRSLHQITHNNLHKIKYIHIIWCMRMCCVCARPTNGANEQTNKRVSGECERQSVNPLINILNLGCECMCEEI